MIGSLTTLASAALSVANGTPNVNSTLTTTAAQFIRFFGFTISHGIPTASCALTYTVVVGSTTVFQGTIHTTTTGTGEGHFSIMLPAGTWIQGAPGEDVVITLTNETTTATLANVRYTLYYRLESVTKGN